MFEFILGFPSGKPTVPENIITYSSMQDAGSNCSYFCAVFSASMEEAKKKLLELANCGRL